MYYLVKDNINELIKDYKIKSTGRPSLFVQLHQAQYYQ